MTPPDSSRYQQVSRRALLKAGLGAGALALTGAACGNPDAEVFAGSVAQPGPTPTPTAGPQPTPTSTPIPDPAAPAPTAAAEPTATATPAGAAVAVAGEMVISFTYTRAAGGKVESPYVAVWIEDAGGELLETVALFFEQGRRGERWLDHLDRWFAVDAARLAAGGSEDRAAISSATRPPGEYAVVWDGQAAGAPVPAGDYFVCVESVREDGPYSLIREPFTLTGSLAPTALADAGELSAASVRIDG